MPENPNALSPSTATTLLPVAIAAPMHEPMPMPIIAHVAQSMRWRGSDMFTASRVSSSVFAPSLTNITSGFDSSTGLIADRAVQWFIGCADAFCCSRSSNLAFFTFVSACSCVTHAGSMLVLWLPSCDNIAVSELSRSPMTGAAIGLFMSISCGSISNCTNFVSEFHLPCPRDSSQFRRAPISTTTSACCIMVERQEMALSGWLSGISPLAIDMG